MVVVTLTTLTGNEARASGVLANVQHFDDFPHSGAQLMLFALFDQLESVVRCQS